MRTWLKEERLKRGYTQQDMADKLGMTKQGYWSIEKGVTQNFRIDTATKLAVILEIPVDKIAYMDAMDLAKEARTTNGPVQEFSNGHIHDAGPTEGKYTSVVRYDSKSDLIKKELVQILKSHNLTVGQATLLLNACASELSARAFQTPV